MGAPYRLERVQISDALGSNESNSWLGETTIRTVIEDFSNNSNIECTPSRADENSHDRHGVILSNHDIHATVDVPVSLMNYKHEKEL